MTQRQRGFSPSICKGIEEPFAKVEKSNQAILAGIKEYRKGKRHHTYFPPARAGAVVVTKLPDGQFVLCFCGDETEQQWINGVTLDVKKRYILPVSEVVGLLGLLPFHENYAKEFTEFYGVKFTPGPKSENFMLEFSEQKTDKEKLGFALFHILQIGKGAIPRNSDSISLRDAPDDGPYQIIKQMAEFYMADNKVSCYA